MIPKDHFGFGFGFEIIMDFAMDIDNKLNLANLVCKVMDEIMECQIFSKVYTKIKALHHAQKIMKFLPKTYFNAIIAGSPTYFKDNLKNVFAAIHQGLLETFPGTIKITPFSPSAGCGVPFPGPKRLNFAHTKNRL